MPEDNVNRTIINTDFIDTCIDTHNLIENASHNEAILLVDRNTNLSRSNSVSGYLQHVMGVPQTKCSWQHSNSVKEDTFYIFYENGISCIDYYLLSEILYNDMIS